MSVRYPLRTLSRSPSAWQGWEGEAVGHEGKGFAGPEALPDSKTEVGPHAQLKHPLHQPDPDPAFGVQG